MLPLSAVMMMSFSTVTISRALVACLSFCMMVACTDKEVSFEYKLEGTLSSDDTPSSTYDALERLKHLVSTEDKVNLLRCDEPPFDESCRYFRVQFRLRLERHVSNDWLRPEDSPLRGHFIQNGITDPEKMSVKLVAEFVDSLDEAR